MKLTHSLVNGQKNSFTCLPAERETGRELNNIMKSCLSVQNSPDTILQTSDLKNRSADVIKAFFKKTIAAQSYNKMFSKGSNFKYLGIALAESSKLKASLHSLQHLNNVSKNYLTKIKEKTQNLTSQEKVLLSKVVDTKIHFRHQSNSNLVDGAGTLNIMSLHKLQSNEIYTAKNTYSEDIRCLNNQDFVFFGVEFSDDKAQIPLNTRHTTVDFGANAYIVDEQFPYGYLTLTDHFYNAIPPALVHEHKKFIAQFSEVINETYRKVHGDKGTKDVPIFNTKDMRLGLGLHLIDFLRNSSDTGFKRFALNKNLDSENLDKILNFVFQPEFHVPRMVSKNNFKEVKLREVSAEDAVKASNFEALSVHMKNKDEACKIMGFAIRNAKKDVVDFLFSKFNFTDKDVIKMSGSHDDIEYLLSDHSADEKILKDFLDRGLVEPNKAFMKVNSGDTMLDNAIKYNKKEMIGILLEYGAIRGEELSGF
ncbi:Shigella flexneri OspC protein [Yersinia massiliensis]|uniref:T3SS effector OspC family protein n=1 Tax=Yersinia massiliensis TaxID=419257 RepID=UPI0005E21D54|nr:T3SS effector OspC family protein [Yersinia massiliensis]CNI03326.1 Shigella flexneri OspC protein [Yersinia massiliensis]